MSDTDFQLNWVPNNYGAMVQRIAVLYPLMGIATTPGQIRYKTYGVIKRWRARLSALYHEGWRPHESNYQYARNCQPTFCFPEPRTRSCNKAQICPFCYARWVRGIWEKIDKAFPNPRDEVGVQKIKIPADINDVAGLTNEPPDHSPSVDAASDDEGRLFRSIEITQGSAGRVQDFPYHLIERKRTINPEYHKAEFAATPTEWVAKVAQTSIATRRERVRDVKPRAAFSSTTISPGKTEGWCVRVCELFMVEKDFVWPEDDEAQITRHERPTRREIMQAVGRVCRYPATLLEGDLSMTVEALNARTGQRLSASYGAFRQSTY